MAIPTAPHAVPLIGHILQLTRDPLRFLESLSQYGKLVRMRIGNQSAIVICDPGLMTEVLRKDEIFDKGGPFGDRIREIIGNSVFSCRHDEHRRRRRLVQPAFQSSRFPAYADLMIREVHSIISGWHEGCVLDMRTEMANLTSSVLTATVYPDLAPALSRQLVEDTLTVVESIFPRVIQPRFFDGFPTKRNRSFNVANRRIRESIRGLVAGQHGATVDMGDLLSGILGGRESGTMSDEEIVDDLIAFTIAGIETHRRSPVLDSASTGGTTDITAPASWRTGYIDGTVELHHVPETPPSPEHTVGVIAMALAGMVCHSHGNERHRT